MAIWLTALADVLRKAGLKVEEQPGWKNRGHGPMQGVRGIVWHHTAGGRNGNYPSLRVVRDGRPGLPGPLAQLGLARDGTFIVIAAGRCWHAGTVRGQYKPHMENSYSIGIEAENTGTGEPWSAAMMDAYRRGTAALAKHYGVPVGNVRGHKEISTAGKIDPYGLDMAKERAKVAAIMAGGTAPAENTSKAPASSGGAWDIRYGNTGTRVLAVQKAFNVWYRKRGWKTRLAEDGSFGPAMRRAVEDFQRASKLTVDGVFGPASQKRLTAASGVKL